ncbi:MAG: glycosyltransferase [Wenzhouxiangella sp.]
MTAPLADAALNLVCLPDASGGMDTAWLDSLRNQLPQAVFWAPARLAQSSGLEALPAASAVMDSVAEQAASQPSSAWLLLESGLRLPDGLMPRLRGWAARLPAGGRLVLPGNYDARVDPLWGSTASLSTSQVDAAIALLAPLKASPVADLPQRAVLITPGTLTKGGDGHLLLADDIYLLGPDILRGRLGDDEAVHPAQLALGQLRLGLERLAREAVPVLPRIGLDDKPVVLHISHAWGGGIARWIRDVIEADDQAHHLVLASHAARDSRHFGERLRLFAAGPDRALLTEFPLSPAIADTALDHADYASVLRSVIGRYRVGKIIVSSLIGHALNALTTGLPTLQVLHDFYPAVPVLDRDPLDFCRPEGGLDISACMDALKAGGLFDCRDAAHWRALRQAWLQAAQGKSLRLLAPSQHVAQRWAALFDQALPEIAVIPHGWPGGWASSAPPARRPRADGKLSLVVVGRLNGGKGLSLLDAALAQLSERAHVTLLGAGQAAMSLFGRAGVDVVLNYQPDELPALLDTVAPEAALFLSTVPETWNYVLNELRALKLPVAATDLGAFAERIEDGRDGFLFEPNPDALVAVVDRLIEQRDGLHELAEAAPQEPGMAETLDRYRELLPFAELPATAQPSGAALGPQTAAAMAFQLSRQNARLSAQAERIDEQEAELARRAEWAERLGHQVANRDQRVLRQQEEIETLSRQVQSLHEQLGELAGRLQAETDRSRALEDHLLMVHQSGSWRLTLPLRLAMRAVRSAREARLWDPRRWAPGLRNVRQGVAEQGAKAALMSWYAGQGWLPVSPVPADTLDVPDVEAITGPAIDPARLNEPVTHRPPETPRVSIVIPVFNKREVTAACLHSLVDTEAGRDFEIIVVDDCSGDDTPDYLAACQGLTVLRNEENAGFIDSCNRGAAAARGEFLVFLNNDTTLTPGWLDALVRVFENHDRVGVVGARLVYPDGRLQEAGGIIFNDASGWNYGRNQHPEAPQYNVLSDADYVSGACLAIPKPLFDSMSGFDVRYRPAYYEDTDLCFRVREAGYRVVYQPLSTVVHHEGASAGTDLASGMKRYQVVNQQRFRERWAEALQGQPAPPADVDRQDPVRHHRFRPRAGHVLVMDAVMPQPDHDSGSVRLVAMLTLIRDMGFHVSFVPENGQRLDHYGDALAEAGIEVLAGAAFAGLDAWLAEYGAGLDWVIVSRHYVLAPWLDRIRQHCPKARLVFDTVDLHYLREQREAEIAQSDAMAAEAARTRVQELRLIRACDQTLVVSPIEQTLLAREVPDAEVRIVSNIHSVHGSATPWAQRQGLMFVGGFQHVPNVDAALWLVESIFPLIRAELPDVELHLIGSRMPREILAINQPGVRVEGFVADLNPFLAGCRISLAPLRYGAGVKGKVNQAMSHGLPVVATPCAAEGMFLVDGQDVLVAERAEDFAQAVVRLYRDRQLWERLSAAGLANVERHFSLEAARQALSGLMQPGKA